MAVDDCPLGPTCKTCVPYGAPQIDVPVQLNTNENPSRPALGAAGRDRRGGRRGPHPQPLPGPRRRCPAHRPGRLPRATGPTWPPRPLGGQRLQRGHPAAAAGLRWPRRRGARFDPGLFDVPAIARAPTPAGIDWGGTQTSPWTGAAARPPSTGQPSRLLTSPNNPTGTSPRWRSSRRSGRGAGPGDDRRGLRRVRSRGHAQRASLLPATPVGRHPHDEQGVRHGRGRFGYLAAAPASWRSCAWSGCPTTCPRPPRQWPGSRSRWRRAAGHGRRPFGPNGTAPSAWLRRRGLQVADSTRTSCCSALSRSPRRLGGPAGSGVWSARLARRLAAGHDLHAGGDGGVREL